MIKGPLIAADNYIFIDYDRVVGRDTTTTCTRDEDQIRKSLEKTRFKVTMESKPKKFKLFNKVKEILLLNDNHELLDTKALKTHRSIKIIGVDNVEKLTATKKLINILARRDLYTTDDLLDMNTIIQNVPLCEFIETKRHNTAITLEMTIQRYPIKSPGAARVTLQKQTDAFIVLGCHYCNSFITDKTEHEPYRPTPVFIIHSASICNNNSCMHLHSNKLYDYRYMTVEGFLDYYKFVKNLILEIYENQKLKPPEVYENQKFKSKTL